MNHQEHILSSLRTQVEALLPGTVTSLKDFQWECATRLLVNKYDCFLMKPCGSGKTYIWITISILLFIWAHAQNISHDVLVIYAPLNEIIRQQVQLVRSMSGWRAYNFSNNPEECEQALKEVRLLHPTIIFWNPHETTETRFLNAIEASVPFRIKAMVSDEAGTVVDWGLGDLFRYILRKVRKFVVAWENVCQRRMPQLVFTGAACPSTRVQIRKIFLGSIQRSFSYEEIDSPLQHCHVRLLVTVVHSRDTETSALKKSILAARHATTPPFKFLVLVPYVKNLESNQKNLLNVLNPDLQRPITDGVVTVFAGPACVTRDIDLQRYAEGATGTERYVGGLVPSTLIATLGAVATGWNVHDINQTWLKGQPNNLDLLIQAWLRTARGGMLFGTCCVIVSWFRRLELQYFTHKAVMGNETQATRENAQRQMDEIDEITRILLFPDNRCLLQTIDTAVLGEVTSMKGCPDRFRNNPERWCSVCFANKNNGSVINELQQFVDQWYAKEEKNPPTDQNYSELLQSSGNCITGVSAKCLKEFLKDQGEPTGSSRADAIQKIRQLMHPVRLTQGDVGNSLQQSLPNNNSTTTMGIIKTNLSSAIRLAPKRLVSECIQRLILKGVLTDQPPTDVTSKESAAANVDSWLVKRGQYFLDYQNWPLLQPPERVRSIRSARVAQKKQNAQQSKKKKTTSKKRKTSKKKK